MHSVRLIILLVLCILIQIDVKAQNAKFNLTGLVAQDFLMSSIGLLPGTTSNTTAINFRSHLTCIDVQSGIETFNSSQNAGTFLIDCTTHQEFNKYGIILFPNPVKEYSKIKFLHAPPLTQLFTIQIWSVEGKMVTMFTENGYQLYQGRSLSLGYLANGTYFIQIESPHSLDAIKFIKVN